MTLNTVAVNDPVLASTHQQVIAKVNASPGRQVFTSNGTFSVPSGIHKFRVFVISGGAEGNALGSGGSGEDSYTIAGEDGLSGFAVSVDYAGVEIGTSFAVVVGAAGGTSSFGSTFSITGATGVSRGTVTAPGGSSPMYHMNGIYCNNSGVPYGSGGAGADLIGTPLQPGVQGVVVVEW